MSKLLLDEQPTLFLPGLAIVFGVHEAIFLQQLHWWLSVSDHVVDGRTWAYNSADEWIATALPFLSLSTFRRMIAGLESQGVVITRKMNAATGDQRKWYTIDQECFAVIVANHAAYQAYREATTVRREKKRVYAGIRLSKAKRSNCSN